MSTSIDWRGNGRAVVAWCWQTGAAGLGWVRGLDPRVLVLLGALLAAAIALLIWGLLTDQTRALNTQEVTAVRRWVLATQAPSVVEAFNARNDDGQLTVKEVQALMEMAKAADMPLGLYQPVQMGESGNAQK